MNYTEEMILRSDSGYCMPFEERDKNVELSLGYGNQRHPVSGETFFTMGWILMRHAIYSRLWLPVQCQV